jgi:hypothetical protein
LTTILSGDALDRKTGGKMFRGLVETPGGGAGSDIGGVKDSVDRLRAERREDARTLNALVAAMPIGVRESMQINLEEGPATRRAALRGLERMDTYAEAAGPLIGVS